MMVKFAMKSKLLAADDDMHKYEVNAKSVEDFVRSYHVRDRRYHEEFKVLVEGEKKWIKEFGYTWLPAHISLTGEMVTYFPRKKASGKRRAE
ncbi:MAG: hypothetical protein LBC31_11755 [Treponema sp.]|jgi:uncharacterized radical SAM superfamily Fe-S cluster-containing enzyme|nr:hypothetical protein [Treponema sp.]